MSRPVISIIIPVYNSEGFLNKCLDSVLSQSFSEWECILVDDGSKDSSGIICDEYASRDSRFHVIHKENGGVSSARNRGIDEATGEWMFFSDSDDALEKDALRLLIGHTSDDIDLVMGGYVVESHFGGIKATAIKEADKLITVEQALTEMYLPTDFSYQGYLWCKLFRTSLVKRFPLKFDPAIYFNEDRLFIVEYLCKTSKSVAYFTQSVYRYVDRPTGAMGALMKSYNPKFATDFTAYVRMYETLVQRKVSPIILTYAKNGIVESFSTNMRFMEQFNMFDNESYILMKQEIKRVGLSAYYLKHSFKTAVANVLRLYSPKTVIKMKNK